jgi:2-keto-3-deoxy-L-rhamnonate aldolase RhmA
LNPEHEERPNVTARSIKERLKAGEKVLAAWIYGLSPVIVEAMALGGYSALMIDQEHGPVELQTVHMLTLAAEARGAQAMVRVPSHDPNHVKRLLDMGLTTVMFPMVDSVADAEAVVAACYYPPRGRRGLATGGIRATSYGGDAKGYLENLRSKYPQKAKARFITAEEVAELVYMSASPRLGALTGAALAFDFGLSAGS